MASLLILTSTGEMIGVWKKAPLLKCKHTITQYDPLFTAMYFPIKKTVQNNTLSNVGRRKEEN